MLDCIPIERYRSAASALFDHEIGLQLLRPADRGQRVTLCAIARIKGAANLARAIEVECPQTGIDLYRRNRITKMCGAIRARMSGTAGRNNSLYATTLTVNVMLACPGPQKTVQCTLYVPFFLGVNVTVANLPG